MAGRMSRTPSPGKKQPLLSPTSAHYHIPTNFKPAQDPQFGNASEHFRQPSPEFAPLAAAEDRALNGTARQGVIGADSAAARSTLHQESDPLPQPHAHQPRPFGDYSSRPGAGESRDERPLPRSGATQYAWHESGDTGGFDGPDNSTGIVADDSSSPGPPQPQPQPQPRPATYTDSAQLVDPSESDFNSVMESLVKCPNPNCHRSFLPDRLAVHLRSCWRINDGRRRQPSLTSRASRNARSSVKSTGGGKKAGKNKPGKSAPVPEPEPVVEETSEVESVEEEAVVEEESEAAPVAPSPPHPSVSVAHSPERHTSPSKHLARSPGSTEPPTFQVHVTNQDSVYDSFEASDDMAFSEGAGTGYTPPDQRSPAAPPKSPVPPLDLSRLKTAPESSSTDNVSYEGVQDAEPDFIYDEGRNDFDAPSDTDGTEPSFNVTSTSTHSAPAEERAQRRRGLTRDEQEKALRELQLSWSKHNAGSRFSKRASADGSASASGFASKDADESSGEQDDNDTGFDDQDQGFSRGTRQRQGSPTRGSRAAHSPRRGASGKGSSLARTPPRQTGGESKTSPGDGSGPRRNKFGKHVADHACQHCGRTFALGRLEVHEKNCVKVFGGGKVRIGERSDVVDNSRSNRRQSLIPRPKTASTDRSSRRTTLAGGSIASSHHKRPSTAAPAPGPRVSTRGRKATKSDLSEESQREADQRRARSPDHRRIDVLPAARNFLRRGSRTRNSSPPRAVGNTNSSSSVISISRAGVPAKKATARPGNTPVVSAIPTSIPRSGKGKGKGKAGTSGLSMKPRGVPPPPPVVTTSLRRNQGTAVKVDHRDDDQVRDDGFPVDDDVSLEEVPPPLPPPSPIEVLELELAGELSSSPVYGKPLVSPAASSPLGGRSPGPRSPLGSVAKSPVAKSPVAKSPVAKSPVAQSPVAQNPVAQSPVAKSPVARSPAAHSPKPLSPAADLPQQSPTPSPKPATSPLPMTSAAIVDHPVKPRPKVASTTKRGASKNKDTKSATKTSSAKVKTGRSASTGEDLVTISPNKLEAANRRQSRIPSQSGNVGKTYQSRLAPRSQSKSASHLGKKTDAELSKATASAGDSSTVPATPESDTERSLLVYELFESDDHILGEVLIDRNTTITELYNMVKDELCVDYKFTMKKRNIPIHHTSQGHRMAWQFFRTKRDFILVHKTKPRPASPPAKSPRRPAHDGSKRSPSPVKHASPASSTTRTPSKASPASSAAAVTPKHTPSRSTPKKTPPAGSSGGRVRPHPSPAVKTPGRAANTGTPSSTGSGTPNFQKATASSQIRASRSSQRRGDLSKDSPVKTKSTTALGGTPTKSPGGAGVTAEGTKVHRTRSRSTSPFRTRANARRARQLSQEAPAVIGSQTEIPVEPPTAARQTAVVEPVTAPPIRQKSNGQPSPYHDTRYQPAPLGQSPSPSRTGIYQSKIGASPSGIPVPVISSQPRGVYSSQSGQGTSPHLAYSPHGVAYTGGHHSPGLLTRTSPQYSSVGKAQPRYDTFSQTR